MLILTPLESRVLHLYDTCTIEEGISIEDAAAQLGVSDSKVLDAVIRLVDIGFIHVEGEPLN